MILWRIYYENGTTFDNTQGSPYDAPFHGVVCIVCRNEKYNRRILSHWDVYYYVKSLNTWLGSQQGFVLWMLAKHSDDYVAPKIGETIPDDSIFDSILLHARNDPDFLQVSPAHDFIQTPRNEEFKGLIDDE